MRLINVNAFLEREGLIREGKRVDYRVKVLEFSDDEATNYTILSHRWLAQEVDHDEMVKLAKMDWKEKVMAIERSSRAASRLKRTDMSGCGSTLAVSTNEAAQSYPRLLIICIGGTKTRRYAMRTSMTSTVHPFPLREITGIPVPMAGRSGSRVGGRFKS